MIRKWYLKNEIILLKRNRITFDHWSDTATIIIFFPMKLFIGRSDMPYLHRLFNCFFFFLFCNIDNGVSPE